jgi:hypothetical protein
MIHRRQSHAIRKVIVNHQNTIEIGWFLSNKYCLFVRSGI